jgi:hypothetical protein
MKAFRYILLVALLTTAVSGFQDCLFRQANHLNDVVVGFSFGLKNDITKKTACVDATYKLET